MPEVKAIIQSEQVLTNYIRYFWPNTLQGLIEFSIYCYNFLASKLVSNPFLIVNAANCTELIRKKKNLKLESEI